MDNSINTIEFLSQALLYPNAITYISEVIDLIPLINRYYSHLIKAEKYSAYKHFKLIMSGLDMNAFEKHGDEFILGYVNKLKNHCPHITKDSVYSLLLNSYIHRNIDRNILNIIENILSTFHEENILIYTNGTNSIFLSIFLCKEPILLKLIESYIERYSKYIIRAKSIHKWDLGNLLETIRYSALQGSYTIDYYINYLKHFYTEEVLTKIIETGSEYYKYYDKLV